jgi:hypothetical protein
MLSAVVTRIAGVLCVWAIAIATFGPVQMVATAQVQEGQLVQAPDGSLFVFEGGELHFIEPVQLSVPDLVGLARGADVTTGVRIIADPAPAAPPAAGPVTPPEVSPAPPQPVGLRIEVIEVQRPFPRTAAAGPGQEWVRLRMRIYAPAAEPIVTGQWYERMRLQFGNGATVNPPQNAIIISDSVVPDVMRQASVPAGSTLEGNTVFSVPVGQQVTKVLWTQGSQTVEAPVQ